jgi:hypothetical protein
MVFRMNPKTMGMKAEQGAKLALHLGAEDA